MSQSSEFLKGIFAGVFCFAFWGLAPLFWKLFDTTSASELLLHRIIWGFFTLFCILFYKGQIKHFFQSIKSKKTFLLLILSSVCISTNWFLFTYAMTTNHIVEASLGYFMNPLMNVFLGRLFLRESLSVRKWVALAFAFFGVMTMFYGKVDGIEISILLASTFALYGLIRKQLGINSEFGLLFELLFASIPALLFFISGGSEQYEFYLAPLSLKLLFICCGLITIIPLFYFVYAAKRLQFSQVGILQYIAPFLQLLVGTVIYDESFTKTHLISFVLIWSAIIIFMSKEMQTLLTTKKVGRNV